jgi:hypothetical protein
VTAQPVELEPVAQGEVDRRGRCQGSSGRTGHVRDVQRGEYRAQDGYALRQL